jgi:hypothetical protein
MALSMAWNGIEKSLADWGIDTTTPTLTLRGWQADEFAFTIAVADAFAIRPLTYGDDIVLLKDGVPIFIGHLRRRPVFGAGAERQKYVAYNFWYNLERLIYEQQRVVIAEDFVTAGVAATTQVVFGRNTATGAKIDTDGEMANLAAFAVLNGVAVGADFAFSGLTAPWEQANDVTVAAGLRRMAAWQPDLLARAEYQTYTAMLRLRRPSDFEVKTINLTAADLVVSLQCERRDDMRPTGVVFNFLTTESNPVTGARFIRVTQQFGGPARVGPGVIKGTISIGEAEEIPANLAANYYAAISTVFLEGTLVLTAREIDTTIRPGDILSFTNGSPEWASTLAMVNEVAHQLSNGTTTISFGPPPTLAASTLAALNQRLKDSRPPPPAPPKDPGNDGGGDADTGLGNPGGPSGATSFQGEVCVGGTDTIKTIMGA